MKAARSFDADDSVRARLRAGPARRPYGASNCGRRGQPGRASTRSWACSSRSTSGFATNQGRELPLADLFGRRPVILAPVYYRCPLLCNQLLNGLTRSLKPVSLGAGKDFDVVAFSINPGRDSRAGGPEEGGLPGAIRSARLANAGGTF